MTKFLIKLTMPTSIRSLPTTYESDDDTNSATCELDIDTNGETCAVYVDMIST